MKRLSLVFILINVLICLNVHASSKAAKVILLKGNVTEFFPRMNRTIMLEQGAWVSQGSIIKTGKASVVKLLFLDKTKVTIGPKSKMAIEKFKKKKAGILSLVKGRLKATVLKNQLDKKGKNKLYIKTKTAAMGVRGTEFMVIHNHLINKTSVTTFSGEVRLAQFNNGPISRLRSSDMNRLLNTDKAVSIRMGQYAGTSKKGRPNIPIKINPAQFRTLKDSGVVGKIGKREVRAKSYQSKIPPGMSGKLFINQNSELENSMRQVVGNQGIKRVEELVDQAIERTRIEVIAPPEGFHDEVTGEFAPRAGGFVDLETGVYVIPPANSEFDPNTETFIPPSYTGSFNEQTGEYMPSGEFELTPEGKFVPRTDGVEGRDSASGDRPLLDPRLIPQTDSANPDAFMPPPPPPGVDGNFDDYPKPPPIYQTTPDPTTLQHTKLIINVKIQ